MNKTSFGIKNFTRNHRSPFEIGMNQQIQKEDFPQKIQINKPFLPKILGLSKTGIRLLVYFIENNHCENGVVGFNLTECKKISGFSDKRSIYNGLIELLGENIIARSDNENFYFLNIEIIKISY